MKHLIKNLFTLFTILLIASVTINAQHHMNHSKSDTTKQMHHMMDDSTKMHHIEIDTSKMMHKNMNHKMDKNMVKEATNKKEIWNSYCPVKGGEVDPEAPTVSYKGKTIGFCCPGCDGKFMEDPEKYMKNLSDDGKKFIGEK